MRSHSIYFMSAINRILVWPIQIIPIKVLFVKIISVAPAQSDRIYLSSYHITVTDCLTRAGVMETLLMNNWLNIFVSYYRVYLQHGLCDSDLDTVSGDHHSTDSTQWSESWELMVSVSWDISWQSQYWWWSWCCSSSCTAVSHQSSGNVHNIRKVCVLVDKVAVFTVVIKSPQCLKNNLKDDLSPP